MRRRSLYIGLNPWFLGAVGGGATPFPLTISGLKLWVDPSSLSDGASIASISGYAADLTQATESARPTAKANTFNGKTALYFDGGDSLTNATKALWKFLHDGSTYTAFVVFATSALNPNAAYGMFGTNGGASASIGMSLFYDDRDSQTRANKLIHFITKGLGGQFVVNNVSNDNVMVPQTTSIISIVVDPVAVGNDSIIGVDGSAVSQADISSGPYNTGDAAYGLFIGQLGNGTNPATGYFGEILAYSPKLSDEDYASVIAYLQAKWGTAALKTSTVVDDAAYYMAPGLTTLADGTIVTVYRKGTSHATDKGSIVMRTSADGVTWSAESTVFTDATYDARDPNITRLTNGTLMVSFFKYNHTTEAYLTDACYVVTSTDDGANWGTPVNINDTFTLQSQVSAHVIQIGSTLILPIFGKNTGDTYDTAALVTSTDGGATWGNQVTIANGETAERICAEVNIVDLGGGSLLALMRDSTAKEINKATSTDNGATWGALSLAFAGWGSPHVTRLSSGKLVATTRDAVNSQVIYYTSTDNGATWSAKTSVDSGPYTRSLYATPLELVGKVGIIYAVEIDAGNADIKYKEYWCNL